MPWSGKRGADHLPHHFFGAAVGARDDRLVRLEFDAECFRGGAEVGADQVAALLRQLYGEAAVRLDVQRGSCLERCLLARCAVGRRLLARGVNLGGREELNDLGGGATRSADRQRECRRGHDVGNVEDDEAIFRAEGKVERFDCAAYGLQELVDGLDSRRTAILEQAFDAILRSTSP